MSKLSSMHSGGLRSQAGERKWQVQKDLEVKRKQKMRQDTARVTSKSQGKKLLFCVLLTAETARKEGVNTPLVLNRFIWYLTDNISDKKANDWVFSEKLLRLRALNTHYSTISAALLMLLSFSQSQPWLGFNYFRINYLLSTIYPPPP